MSQNIRAENVYAEGPPVSSLSSRTSNAARPLYPPRSSVRPPLPARNPLRPTLPARSQAHNSDSTRPPPLAPGDVNGDRPPLLARNRTYSAEPVAVGFVASSSLASSPTTVGMSSIAVSNDTLLLSSERKVRQ